MIKALTTNQVPEFAGTQGEHYAVINNDGVVLAYFGLIMHWDFVGRVYYRHASGHGIADTRMILKAVRRVLRERSHYYDRIEATVDISSDVDTKFALKLNFVIEGCMKKYIDGENHYLMRYSYV